MADVRLTSTNPDDSSVVPVACNAKGELLLEEPIDNSFDGNLDGDLIVSGKVGIGTTDPKAPLHVFNSSLDLPAIGEPGNVQVGGSAFGLMLGVDSYGQGYLQAQRNDGANTTYDLLLNPNGGKVGIGTTDPRTALYISGDSAATSRITCERDGAKGVFGVLDEDVIIVGEGSDGTNGGITFYTGGSPKARMDPAGSLIIGGSFPASPNISLNTDGRANFEGEVVVSSRNKQWMLAEQNGLCHMIEQTGSISFDKYPELRDVFAELDVIEKALEEVMEKLRMSPPAGWPVWDGSDNKQKLNRLE